MIREPKGYVRYIELKNKYSIYYNLEDGIIVYDISSDSYFSKEIIEIKNSSFKVLDILSLIRDASDIEDLNLLIDERIKVPVIGREIILYAGKEEDGDSFYYDSFNENQDMMSLFGVDDPLKVKLTVIEVSREEDSFEKDDASNIVFGIWEIDENEICSSFIFRSIIQSKICFTDLAKGTISRGSYYLKMKVEEL